MITNTKLAISLFYESISKDYTIEIRCNHQIWFLLKYLEERSPSIDLSFSLNFLFDINDNEGQFNYGFSSASSKQFSDKLI